MAELLNDGSIAPAPSQTVREIRARIAVEVREWRLDTNYGTKGLNVDKLADLFSLGYQVGITRRQMLAAIGGARLAGVE